MATAPKHPVSAAQKRAGQAFAAGGRAAQAKAAKSPKTAAAQHQKRVRAGQKAAATRKRNAAQAAKNARTRGKAPVVQSKKRAAVAPDTLERLPGWSWLMACNDVAPTCAAAAVANHLLACTGLRMTDENVMELHQLAGGDEGATIEAVLECIKSHRSAFGQASKAYLATFFPTDHNVIVAGLVVGVRLGHAGHAVVSTSKGMISWGRAMPWDGEPEEAWCLEWVR